MQESHRESATTPADAESPLAGIRVVALEHAVAAPLCTRHLVDLGAEVVKVERPDGGDIARSYDTVIHGESTYFVWLNQGKQSIALDLSDERDHGLLLALLAEADVFVHNLGPGSVDRLRLGWERLHDQWPALISCAISGYGSDGPYRDRKAFDLLLQGESGLMSLTGTPESPAKVGISVADISAGMYALTSILAALIARSRTGIGTFIDISMLECLGEWVMAPLYHQLYAGSPPARAGMRHNMIVPYGPYRVAGGGVVNVAVQSAAQWERFCGEVLRDPGLARDPRYLTNELRVSNRTTLEATIEEILGSESRETVIARMDAADLPSGAMNELRDVATHPQLEARQRWIDTPTPTGSAQSLTHPFNLRGMPRRAGAVPMLGEHTDQIRRRLLPEQPDAASDHPAATGDGR